MKIEIDKNNLVMNPSIHDGFLQGVCLGENQSCRLMFKSLTGRRIDLILHGVKNFRANEFMEGNVVGEMFVFCGDEIPINRLEQLIYGKHAPEGTYLTCVLEESSKNNLLLFELEPSYGCKIQALCEAIECVFV